MRPNPARDLIWSVVNLIAYHVQHPTRLDYWLFIMFVASWYGLLWGFLESDLKSASIPPYLKLLVRKNGEPGAELFSERREKETEEHTHVYKS